MDYSEIVQITENRVGKIFPQIILDLKECIAAGATGGEIMSRVGKYLKELDIIHPEAYQIMKEDILKYLLSCKSKGLDIR